MAWFKDTDEDTPTPVTADRVLDVVKNQLEFQGNDEDEGKFYCYVNGIPVRFDTSPLNFAYYINTSMFEHALPGDRYGDLLKWVSEFNFNTHFLHTYVVRREEDNSVMLCADAPVIVEAGMTDRQLRSSLEHALSGLIVCGTRFCEDFGLQLDAGEPSDS